MSRRSKNRRRRSERLVHSEPLPPYHPTLSAPRQQAWARFSPLRTRDLSLALPVFAPRTVRPPLIRTVLTDTTLRTVRNKARSPLPRRRRSPDLPNRSLDRMRSWSTRWPELGEVPIPRQRAVTCARRSIRREVLLALGRGNGAGSRDKPKSKEKC